MSLSHFSNIRALLLSSAESYAFVLHEHVHITFRQGVACQQVFCAEFLLADLEPVVSVEQELAISIELPVVIFEVILIDEAFGDQLLIFGDAVLGLEYAELGPVVNAVWFNRVFLLLNNRD